MEHYNELRDMVMNMFGDPVVFSRQQIIMSVKGVAPSWAKRLIERLQEAHDEDADDGGSKWFFARFSFPPGLESSTTDKQQNAPMVINDDVEIIGNDAGDDRVKAENAHLWGDLGF